MPRFVALYGEGVDPTLDIEMGPLEKVAEIVAVELQPILAAHSR